MSASLPLLLSFSFFSPFLPSYRGVDHAVADGGRRMACGGAMTRGGGRRCGEAAGSRGRRWLYGDEATTADEVGGGNRWRPTTLTSTTVPSTTLMMTPLTTSVADDSGLGSGTEGRRQRRLGTSAADAEGAASAEGGRHRGGG
jgi:hypothetical protein